MDSKQKSKDDDKQNISTEKKVSKNEQCISNDRKCQSIEVSKCDVKGPVTSKSTDTCDSDQEENSLVIDLDQIPDVVQTPSSERKMDNVFDRILSDVSFPTLSSSKRISPTCSSNLLHKDSGVKKESIDDTVRGLENLEHCLKEFEGKLKQNGSCSKNESKDKTLEVTGNKSKLDEDQRLQDEMDALLSEFNDIKSTAVGIQKSEPASNNLKTKDNKNTKIIDNNCFDTETTLVDDTSNEPSSDTLKVTRKEIVRRNAEESSEKDEKTNETDASTIQNTNRLLLNKNDVSDKCDGTEKKKTSEIDTNGEDLIDGCNKDPVDIEPNPAFVSITDKSTSPKKIKSNEEVNNENDRVTETNNSPIPEDAHAIAENKKESSCVSGCKKIPSEDSLSVVNENAENIQVPMNDERRRNADNTIAGTDSTQMLTGKDVSRVVYRYKGARQMSREDSVATACKVCCKDSCICTSDNQNELEKNIVNQTEKVHTVINPVRRNSSISNGVTQQQKTTAAWSKLGMRRCDNCRFTTDDSSLFDSHSVICSRKLAKAEIRLRFSDGKFNCQNCSYPTSIRKKFEEHIALHLMAEPYICMTCDITFESKKEIELHVKEKHLKETVKCGLKGSKRIGQIIDTLVKAERHSFIGRVIDRRSQKTSSESKTQVQAQVENNCTVTSSASFLTKAVDAEGVIPVTVSSSSISKQKENDVIFVSASTVTSVNTSSTVPAKSPDSRNLKPTPPQTSVTTQRPLILVPVNNMSGNLFIPFSGVSPQTAQTMQNPSTTVSISSSTMLAPPLTVNNQFLNITPLRFGTQNITFQGSQIQTNVVPQNNEASNKSNQITTPSTLRLAQNFTIHGNTIHQNAIQQGGTGTVIPPQPIGQANSINMQNNQTRYIILPPGPLSSVVGTTQISNQQQNQLVNLPTVIPMKTSESIQKTVVSVTNNTTVRPIVAQAHTESSFSLASSTIPKTIATATTSSTLPAVDIIANSPVVSSNTDVSKLKLTQKSSVVDNDGNKLFFRKCGELYMCDFCKSETPLEDAFKEHIWKHFHQMQKICKECAPDYNSSTPCKIVLKVMIGLLNTASNLPTQQNSTVSTALKEVVMISDDEDDNSDKKDQEKSKNQSREDKNQNKKEEMIVAVDSGKSTPELIDESSLQLKITSTFSLSDTSKSDSEENKTEGIDYTNCKTIQEKMLAEATCMEIDISGEKDDRTSFTDVHNEKTRSKNDLEADTSISNIKASDTSTTAILSNDVQIKEQKLEKNSLHQDPTCSHEKEEIKHVKITEKRHEHQIAQEKKCEENAKFAENTPAKEIDAKKDTSCSVAFKENTSCSEIFEKESDITKRRKLTETEITVKKSDCIGDSVKHTNSVNIVSPKKDDIKSSEIEDEERNTSLRDRPPPLNNTSVTVDSNCTEPPHDLFTLPNSSTEEDIAGQNVSVAMEMDRKPIAFPLVAFYKCGFDACNFNAATSHEFRDHLSQAHSDALEYKCAHCGQKSFTEDSHIRHLLFHSKPQNSFLFQCGIIGCRFRANLLHIYKDHLEQMHQNVILYRCHSCKDGLPSVELLIEHLQNNLLKFVQCPYCSMKDGVRRNVLNHIANCHQGKPRQINVTSQLICQERETNEYDRTHTKLASNENSCIENMSNSRESTGNEHQNNTNPQEEGTHSPDIIENDPGDEQMINKITSNPSIMGATYYRCHTCTYLGIGQSKLNKHSEMHKSGFVQQSQRTFVCPECPQSVNILQQFISHLNLHVGEHLCNVYICQHCGFGTNLSNKIQHHVTGTHGSNERGKDYTERSIRFSVKVICCKKCSAAFKTSQAHREHVLKSHGITTNEISGKDDLEYDKTANQSLSNENKREKHMSTTETSNLSPPHGNEEDTNKRRFTCNECGWATRKLSFLKHHLKKHFLGQDKCQVTLFKCNYCEFDSTSKLIISGHSQTMHAGKLLRVKRIVETIYITESPENDLSIDKFHCDLCTFSCEKVSTLQTHLKDSHSGTKSLNEPTKPKDIYTGPKREFLIPSGTVFKDVIQCSMCTFRTKKRIELLRHIKIHPSLEPKTETTCSKDLPNGEKVQNPLFESYYKLGMKRKNSSDGNPVMKRPRPLSPTISYDRIMMDTAKRDTGYRKQVATKSTTNRGGDTIKSMLYFLGGDQLHLKLKPCFSEFKESSKYYCLICNDVFEDKYKLHKHILQHMKVYFYKCAYCEHGTLDQTQIMVHIQREHRRAIQYSKLDVEEIDSHINKAIHDMKSQVGSGKEKIIFEEMPKDTKSEMLQKDEAKENKNGIKLERPHNIENQNMKIKDKQVTNVTKNTEMAEVSPLCDVKKERISPLKISPLKISPLKISPLKSYQKEKTFKHWGNVENLTVKANKKSEDQNENIDNENKPLEDKAQNQSFHPIMNKSGDMFRCTICKDECRNRTTANKHARAHSKVRRYMCSICQFNYVSRWPGDVKKHIEVKHRKVDTALCLWDDITPCDITPGGIPFNESKFGIKISNPPMLLSDFNMAKKEVPAEDVESDISDIKLNNPSKRPLKIKLSLGTLSERKVDSDEVKTWKKIYKCLVCGKTFKSKHAIHQHFRIECKDPLYGCSSCKFKNVNENKVEKHVKDSHEENNAEVVERSRCHKIRMYKVPRQKDSSKARNKIEGGNKKATAMGVLFKCIVCKRTFKNRNAAWYHAISALCNKTIKKCSLCDFKDVSEDQVESHIKKTHKDKCAKFVELPKEAKIEMIPSSSSLKMNRHKPGSITFFTKEGSDYKCRLCDFKCQNINSVIQHQTLHNSTPAHHCPYCDMKSNYIKSVKNHVKLRHPKKVVNVKSLRNDNETCKKVVPSATKSNSFENKCVMHKCLHCNYRCETYSGVSRHIKRTESCNIPRFKCKECRKFSSINEIEVVEHMRSVHNSKELPEICSLKEMTKMIIVKKKSGDDTLKNKKTNKYENMEKSRMIEKFSGIKDIDTKVITCPAHSCNFKDKVIKVLEHYRKQHTSRIMKCKMCHLTSKSLGIMFMHFKDFHKLEDYFSTNFLVCSKTREEKETENTEQIVETEKIKEDKNLFKTYKCDRCEYNAYSKNSVRQHVYRHLNYKKYMCRLCKAEFLIRQAVEKHLTVIHSTDVEDFDEIRNDRIEKEVELLLDKGIVWKPREDINIEQDTSSDNDLPKKGDSKSEKIKNVKKILAKKEHKECVNKVYTKKNSETTVKIKIDYTKLSADLFIQSNYINEVLNRKTTEMEYLCKECPYKSIARHCALGHTYKHMPKCMKCPYCNYQSYPRTVVTKHVKAVHADKQAHVIDLRYQVSNSSQPKEKKPPPSPVKKRKKTFLDFDAEIFTSEGSSDEDDNNDNKKRKIPEQNRKPGTRERVHYKNRKTRYICNFCDYHTDVLYLYRQHLTFHKGFKYQIQGSTLESKNKCGYCGYISTSSKEFDSHMEKHLNSRPFNCPYCPFSQYTQAAVKYHIQNAHRGEKVQVLKDSTSSFLTGDGKVAQTLLVNFEPKVRLNDIFAMESDAFENLLITANVSVIDLHSIPDEQFGNVSKLLGVNGDGSDKIRHNDNVEQTDGEDEVDGGSSIQIDERNYSDVSDDETHTSDDDSRAAHDELSKSEKIQDRNYKTMNASNNKTNTELCIGTSKQQTVPQYEDVSDEEMDTENSDSMISVNGGKFFVKSELTYEDISDDDAV